MHPKKPVVSIAAALLAVLLAACTNAATPPGGTTPTATSAGVSASTPTTDPPATPLITASMPPATAAGPVRCAVTPDASPAAEIGTFADGLPDFDGEATIKAGEAVAFVSGGDGPHTVTEGYYGEVVPNPCVDESLPNNATLTVTFSEPGVYQIACRPHPVMQTTVTVE